MKSIKSPKDIKFGTTYHMTWNDTLYLFRQSNPNNSNCQYMTITGGRTGSYGTHGGHKNCVKSIDNKMTREATYEETAWLDACIKAGTSVDKPNVHEAYEIY